MNFHLSVHTYIAVFQHDCRLLTFVRICLDWVTKSPGFISHFIVYIYRLPYIRSFVWPFYTNVPRFQGGRTTQGGRLLNEMWNVHVKNECRNVKL